MDDRGAAAQERLLEYILVTVDQEPVGRRGREDGRITDGNRGPVHPNRPPVESRRDYRAAGVEQPGKKVLAAIFDSWPRLVLAPGRRTAQFHEGGE